MGATVTAGAEPKLLSIPRAAARLGVDGDTLKKAIGAGQVPVVRLGERMWIPSLAVDKMLLGMPAGDGYNNAPRRGASDRGVV